MKRILFAIAVLATGAVSGCDDCRKGGTEDLLAKMRSFTAKMCKCTTKECAEAVDKEMLEWGRANTGKFEKSATKAQEEAADKLDDEMDACRHKAMGG